MLCGKYGFRLMTCVFRAVGRSENPGVPIVIWGHNRRPLVEIGLTDLSKSGGAMAETTGL